MCQRITGPLKGTISPIQMTSPLLAHLSPISIRSNLTHVDSVPSFGSELSLFFLRGLFHSRSICVTWKTFFSLLSLFFLNQRLFSVNTCRFTILSPNWQFPPPHTLFLFSKVQIPGLRSLSTVNFPALVFMRPCACVRARPPPALAHRAKRGPYLSLS